MDSITLCAAGLTVLPGAGPACGMILAIMPRCDKQSNESIYQVDKDAVPE
jgi:hypothetical protein